MTTPLWNVSKKRRAPYDNHSLAVDWSLQDYYNMAERCIGRFASRSSVRYMLASEDAISFIAEYLMYAAYRWKKERGCSVKTYLNKCAIWGIYRWIEMWKRTPQLQSLNVEWGDRRTQYHETIAASNRTCGHGRILKILEKSGLTERQKYCLEAIYVNGDTQKDIAVHFGVTRQAISQCVNTAIKKIRVSLNE